MKKVAIFVSGNGTNMENLIRAAREGKVPAEIELVISDNPAAGAIAKAEQYGVKVRIVERKNFASKQEFEDEITWYLQENKIDFVALAGFMKILSPEFVKRYWGRIVNVHPAYLPHFPGAHAIKEAFEAKVAETGVTVHFVDAGVDTGPVILQRKVPVHPDDTVEELETRVHAAEYEIYPEALKLVLEGKVNLRKV